MSLASQDPQRSRRSLWIISGFVLLVIFHFKLATTNWGSGFMIGHEFRQAQTALIADYIDRQNNFSLYYETPILGKPWAFPLEAPFYQWCVVGVKRMLDIPDFQAARGISLLCFYLTLPALYLLLSVFRISATGRLLILTPLLACPIYVFYSRSFLIDPMAAMLSAWFLASFVMTLSQRRWWWFGLASLTATAAILIKSLVFAVWLFPAALYGAWILWRNIREKAGIRAIVCTLVWGIGPVVLPYLALRNWIFYTDALKASHPGAFEFTSEELSKGNFGTFSLSSRLSPETWQTLGQRWSETVGSPLLIALTLGVGLILTPGKWRPILGLTGLWLFGQLAFPYAYAYQDYYFYSATFFLMLAFGVVIHGLITSPIRWAIPRSLLVVVAMLPLAGMFHGYWQGYGKMQRVQSNGGSGLTAMLRDMFPEGSVIMGLGFDWSAIIPYYSGHRALMVRDSQRYDLDYLRGAIKDLEAEPVVALLVSEDMAVTGPNVVKEVVTELRLVPVPMLRQVEGGKAVEVYVSPYFYEEIVRRMGPSGGSRYPHVDLLLTHVPEEGILWGGQQISAGMARAAFPMIEARVTRYDIAYGYRRFWIQENVVINFHPDSSIWVEPVSSRGWINWEVGFLDDVSFRVEAENKNGHRRTIMERALLPASQPEDRGFVTMEVPYRLEVGEVLRFSSGGVSSHAFDWVYLVGIEFSD